MAKLLSGKIRKKSKCELEIELDAYCNTYFDATDSEAPELELEEEDSIDTVDRTSLNSVLANLPMFFRDQANA